MPSSRRLIRACRRRPVAACVVAAAAALGLVVAGAADPPAASAKAPHLIKAFRINSVECVAGPANTVRARVGLWMRVINYGPGRDWADRMEAKVRLESTSPGLNIHSNWAKSKTPRLTQNRRHTYFWNLLTDNKSGTATWRVHIQLVWHRPAPIPNVKKDVYRSFDASCATSTGALPPPSAALPAPGAG
jgi:hypothetical protein